MSDPIAAALAAAAMPIVAISIEIIKPDLIYGSVRSLEGKL